jgi:hypothetical protein
MLQPKISCPGDSVSLFKSGISKLELKNDQKSSANNMSKFSSGIFRAKLEYCITNPKASMHFFLSEI